MKKLILAISVVAAFASCEKQAAKVETGMIKVTPIVEEQNTNDISKKDAVNRGSVPVYVSAINVNTNMDGLTTDTRFDIVDDESGVDNFILEDVPLGYNLLTANTEPNVPTLRRLFQTTSGSSALDDWDTSEMRGEVVGHLIELAHDASAHYTQDRIPPYAIYNGTANTTLIEGVPANVAIDMDTEYGRSFFSIAAENAYDLAHYIIKIRANFYDIDDNMVYSNEVYYDNGSQMTIGIWSDELSVDGARVELELKWYADSDPTTLLNDKSTSFTIRAKQDIYTRITLKRSTFVLEQVGLTFDFQPIVPSDEDIVIN